MIKPVGPAGGGDHIGTPYLIKKKITLYITCTCISDFGIVYRVDFFILRWGLPMEVIHVGGVGERY